jgi:hypothetical protein
LPIYENEPPVLGHRTDRAADSCAHRPDTRIADLTREYVAGRISYRRYHDLCYAISAENHPHYPSGGTSSSDSSSSDNTERDNRHEKETRDKQNADTAGQQSLRDRNDWSGLRKQVAVFQSSEFRVPSSARRRRLAKWKACSAVVKPLRGAEL